MTIAERSCGCFQKVCRCAVLLVLVLAVLVPFLLTQVAQCQSYSVLFTFHGTRGKYPAAGLVRGPWGNLYGVTPYGGDISTNPSCSSSLTGGCGVVFELKKKSYFAKERVLHTFTVAGVATDGEFPTGALVRDDAGNLYGTASGGGAFGAGTVFKIDASGNYSVLYTFTGAADGAAPHAGLVQDAAGNLYGTTVGGGAYGNGVVFKLDPFANYSVLYSFTGGDDGAGPLAALVFDADGNLYGTAPGGGAYGHGVVFKLDPSATFSVLYSFIGGSDGASPAARLFPDESGNLYGTTQYGGTPGCWLNLGCGTVFRLDSTGQLTVVYGFTGGFDGSNPAAGVVRDAAGNLYGTAEYGGLSQTAHCFRVRTFQGCGGVLFKIDAANTFSVAHRFAGDRSGDGFHPAADLLLDPAGNVYGTTVRGGQPYNRSHATRGTVFLFTPQ